MLQALNLGGGGCFNLARQGIAALLNSATFEASYDYPSPATDFNSLKSLIASSLASGNCGALASKLDIANNNHDNGVCENIQIEVSAQRRKPVRKTKNARPQQRNQRSKNIRQNRR